jgi:hypothetical protein
MGDSARRRDVTSRALHSDRSPLHDVRHRARADNVGSARIVFSRTSFEPAGASGGARRDRTDDLLLAKQALSQLSYGPDQAILLACQS